MKRQLLLKRITCAIITIFLSGCMPSNPMWKTPTSVTALPPTWTPCPIETPTVTLDPTQELFRSCSGWNCSLEGVIYANAASLGNELAGINVHLQQISWCSPTKGEYETITGTDGTFRFDVYLHDTDSFWIELAVEGYQPVRQGIGGFDCLYCACPPIEIILQPME
jgi:hypothetical protein